MTSNFCLQTLPIRILFIIPTLDRAGSEKQLVLLAAHLPRDPFDVSVCALTRGGPLNATAIFPTRIYEVGFGQFKFGEAAAYGSLSVLVLVLFVGLLLVVQRRQVRTA